MWTRGLALAQGIAPKRGEKGERTPSLSCKLLTSGARFSCGPLGQVRWALFTQVRVTMHRCTQWATNDLQSELQLDV